MNQRATFPYVDDVAVIRAFLNGKKYIATDRIALDKGKLVLDGATVAWIDTGGSLTVSLSSGYPVTCIRLFEQIADMLGIDDMKLSYGRDPDDGELRWFVGDRDLKPGEHLVVAGPLSLHAFRASEK